MLLKCSVLGLKGNVLHSLCMIWFYIVFLGNFALHTHISFEYTDRADDFKKKTRRVAGVKFIKLFIQHVLPKRFMKIRNYGFLSSRNKTPMLKKLFEYFDKPAYKKPKTILVVELLKLIHNVEFGVCKHCGGRMRVIESKDRPQKTRASPIIKVA